MNTLDIERIVRKTQELQNKELKSINDTVFQITKNELLVFWDKSLDNNKIICLILAPSAFRIPISLVLLSAVNEANPNSPRQEIRIATNEEGINSPFYG